MTHKIGRAKFEVLEKEIAYEGKPMHGELPIVGKLTSYKVSTTDLSEILFGVVTWPDGISEAIPISFLEGQDKYQRLENAGRWSLANHGEFWVGELNAMKYNAEMRRANLASASYEDLSAFAEADLLETLKTFGQVEIDTKENLYGETNRNKSRLSLRCEKGNKDLIASAYVVTRVLAILKDHGM